MRLVLGAFARHLPAFSLNDEDQEPRPKESLVFPGRTAMRTTEPQPDSPVDNQTGQVRFNFRCAKLSFALLAGCKSQSGKG
jgi:hypothetical protein